MFLVEVGLYQLDAEMPLDLKHKLKDIDGIDFQFATEQRLIVAQILRSHVGNPQALQYNGLKLFLYGWHNAYRRQYSTALTGRSYTPCHSESGAPLIFPQPAKSTLSKSIYQSVLLQSSINADYLACNVACLPRSQKHYQRRHVFGHAKAPQRNFRK
jgi:hypothetical protein